MTHGFEDDAAFCERMLAGDERVDVNGAYARHVALRARRPRLTLGLGLGLAAAAVVVLLLTTPIGSIAQNFLTIFAPKQFVPVDVSSLSHADARLLPDLKEFGTLHNRNEVAAREVAGVAQAERIAGFHVATPSSVPSSIPRVIRYRVSARNDQAFTFSAAKARASAARKGQKLPPMPAHLDGTTISASIGPIVIQTWGNHEPHHGSAKRESEGPYLVVAQGVAPVVRSSGASLAELENYLLAMPGVSPQLAGEIRALGDLSSTLPVPFSSAKQSAQSVSVNGAQGLAIGDNTGLGAGVLWQKNGKIYGVFGTLPEDQVLQIADGLH
jgi:hypothetical protein